MGSQAIPLPGMGNDPVGNQTTPLQSLQQILARQTPPPMVGSTSVGPQIPGPQPIGRHMDVPQAGGASGEFSTKGGHTRASMAGLANSVQSTVAKSMNAYNDHQNKQLGQKFQSLVGSQKGIQAAQEMQQNAQKVLAQDPTNADAQKMLQQSQEMMQHNTTILNQLLDPTTPEGKKNIKLFNKGFGFDDKNSDTPERAAAIEAMKKQQPGLNQGAASLMSQMPTGIGMSPQTQVNADMVKAGVSPKAATGGQVLAAETKAATTGATIDAKKAAQEERLGLNPDGSPKAIKDLPPAMQAKVTESRAQEDYKKAQTALDQAKQAALADPRSPQNQLSLMRASAMQKFAAASMLRAHVGYLNYQMNSTGTGESGETLPGTTMINGQPVGPKFAGAATKAIQTQAQFIDADGALDNLSAAAKALHDSGGKLNDPRIVSILSDPHFKAGDSQWFDNQMKSATASSLTSQQRDYLIAQKQGVENLQAIRKVLGLGVSNKSMDAIIKTMPGAQTPDFDYAARQLTAVKGQLQRLQQGVPGINVPSRANQPAAPADKKFDFTQYPEVK